MITIFIAGASASGKSLLAKQLFTKLTGIGTSSLLMKMDDYYKEIPEGVDLAQYCSETNFDTPTILDLFLLEKHITALERGENINKPVFDFTTARRVRFETIFPPDILIIEGIFALYFCKKYLTDDPKRLNVFIETDSYFTLLNRRVARDLKERDRSDKKYILQKEHEYVGPAFFGIIAPSKTFADLIVDNSEEHCVSSDPEPFSKEMDTIFTELEKIREAARQLQTTQAASC